MIATLIRREFLEHVTSLRLSVLLIMTTGLLVTSAAYFSARYDSTTTQSPFVRPGASQGLVDKDGKTNLMMAPCTGFGLHRALSPLGFLAGAGEREFPDLVMVAPHGLKSIQRETKTGEAFEPAAPADWAYLIGVILSFGAGLLTYRSVSGERRDGTLAQVLANPVPKSMPLLAKYLAALLALAFVLTFAMASGVLTLIILGKVSLGGDDWMKLSLFWGTSILYLSFFVLLGLLSSVAGRSPMMSAAGFLLNWTLLVFIIPNLGGIIAGFDHTVLPPREISAMEQAISARYPEPPGTTLQQSSVIMLEREDASEALLIQHFHAMCGQVGTGERFARLSPSAVYAYAAEATAGGGVPRLIQFVDNAVRYRKGLFQAMLDADRSDPSSQHIYIPYRCGGNVFSPRNVDLGPAKEFRDLPPSSGESLLAAMWDLLLLGVYNLLAFAVAFTWFLRQDVAALPGE